ncbi:MAG: type II/IV secretion system ATPase subunit [Candidatus Bathyarchaeia archaeon]
MIKVEVTMKTPIKDNSGIDGLNVNGEGENLVKVGRGDSFGRNTDLKMVRHAKQSPINESMGRIMESLELQCDFPIIERYELGKGVEAKVVKETSNQLRYVVVEPALTRDEETLLEEIKELLMDELDVDARRIGSKTESENFLAGEIEKLVRKYRITVNDETLSKVRYYITRDFVGYGKIDPLMHDPYVEDISCNGPGLPIYIWHREFESLPTNLVFSTHEELDRFVVKLTGMTSRSVSIAQPVVDATLPDGSRVQVTYEREVTRRGSSFTIRRFRERPLTITDLILNKTLSAEVAAWFWYVIEKRASIIVVGGTASGKTTMINMLSMFIKPTSKIISIEDTAELQLPHENWLPSVVRSGFGVSGKQAEITLFDLLKNAMRQRPEYLIVGEVRGSEAYTLFQAMATGHGGLATLHADSVETAIRRLENEPMNIPRSLITTLEAIVVIGRVRLKEKSVRRVLTVTEIVGLDPLTKEILAKGIFEWNPQTDSYNSEKKSYLLGKIMERHGLSYTEVEQELANRRRVIEWMAKNKIQDYRDVVEVIRSYYMDPLSLRERIGM